MRPTLGLSMFIAGTLLSGPANRVDASVITAGFLATVSFVTGPHASSFVLGETVSGSYDIDTSVADTDPDPDVGRYPKEALVSLRVVFGGGGSTFVAMGGPGIEGVAVFNDADEGGGLFTDQLFLFGWTPLSGELGGSPLLAMEVDLLDGFLGSPPDMLVSDALPTTSLAFEEGTVFLIAEGETDWTEIEFAPVAAEPVVPEPTTLGLLALGLGGLALRGRRRREG
jgi:hypothetical protein